MSRSRRIILRRQGKPTRGNRRGRPQYDLSVESSELSDAEAVDVSRDPNVHAHAFDMPATVRPASSEDVDDSGFDSHAYTTWGLDAIGLTDEAGNAEDVVAAILDTGIDATHPAFAHVPLEEKDFTGEGNGDQSGHGTHCAGTFFGGDVAGRRIGVCRQVKRALVGKILDQHLDGTTGSIVNGIEWALSKGANVVSLSVAIDFSRYVKQLRERDDLPEEIATSRALKAYQENLSLFEAIATWARQRDRKSGCVLVAASGNTSRRDRSPLQSVSAGNPAATDGFVAVGAVGQGDDGLVVAPFSNVGVDIVAPGMKIRSAALNGETKLKSGTSMAAPHVAGVAALWAQSLLESRASLASSELHAKLLGSTHASNIVLTSDVGVDAHGLGLVQAPQAREVSVGPERRAARRQRLRST